MLQQERKRGTKKEQGERRERSNQPMAAYRIEVGRRHRVEPRQIVGALANEGGLGRDDFGFIQIRPDFSIVELPAELPREVLDRLEKTRISGQLIELKPDRGGRSRRDGDSKRDFKSGRDDRGGRGDRGRDDRPKRGRDDRGRDEQSWRDGRSSRPARKPRHK